MPHTFGVQVERGSEKEGVQPPKTAKSQGGLR